MEMSTSNRKENPLQNLDLNVEEKIYSNVLNELINIQNFIIILPSNSSIGRRSIKIQNQTDVAEDL